MKLPGQAWLEFKIINTLYKLLPFKPRGFGKNYTGTHYLFMDSFFNGMLNKLINSFFSIMYPLTPLKMFVQLTLSMLYFLIVSTKEATKHEINSTLTQLYYNKSLYYPALYVAIALSLAKA
jgi:hypothetical protein